MRRTAALFSGPKTYFFARDQYIRVTRGSTGGGTLDPGYPKKIADVWGWGDFGSTGINAAFQSGPNKAYFFSGPYYIRVTRRADTGGSGQIDPSYPRKIVDEWNWGNFGQLGIDAALRSGSKTYFFAGPEYIRVTRGETGAGSIDPGYPKKISDEWGWGDFGRNGIDAALRSDPKTYFFSGTQYIRVTRGETGAGEIDPGYPKNIADHWDWPGSFQDLWFSG